ncbi:MAG: histidine kinase [Chitinophagaceae bacterium]|nr:histidine kinase [Chitinophagaceae bacterium]
MLLLLCSQFFVYGQQTAILLSQYKLAKSINQQGEIYKEINDFYTKPYLLEKEQLLLHDAQAAKNRKAYTDYVILYSIYGSLQGVKGLNEESNLVCDKLLQEESTYLDSLIRLKLYLTKGFNYSKKIKFTEANKMFVTARDLALKIGSSKDHISAELGLLAGYLFVRQPDKGLADLERVQALIPASELDFYQPKFYRIKFTCQLLKTLKGEKYSRKEMMDYALKCEEYSKKQDDEVSLLSVYFSLGLFYSGEERNDTLSEKYLLKAIESGKKAGCFREIYLAYNYLVQNSLRQNNLADAERYARASILDVSIPDFEEFRIEKYYSLAGIYLKKNEGNKVMEMIDSIRSNMILSFNRRYDNSYSELQTKYETAQKEKTIGQLDKENQQKKLVIAQQATSLLKKKLEEEQRTHQIGLLNKDKMLLSTSNELLFKKNELNEVVIEKREAEIDRQKVEKEKQRVVIDKLNALQKYQQLRNAFIYSLFGIGLLLAGIFYYWQRNKQRQRNNLEKQRYEVEILEGKLATYSAQMNPHFMFNSMNAVNSFILNNNSLEASQYLSKYSKLMRQVLENSQHKLISLQDELDTLKLYVDMEQLRFANRFTYDLGWDDSIILDDIKIPPLILQPYVENAICHGLMHKEGEGRVKIYIQDCDDHFICSIDDDGVGRAFAATLKKVSKKSHHSMGLQITASRLKILNPSIAEADIVKIIDKVDGNGNAQGTRVEIYLPEVV